MAEELDYGLALFDGALGGTPHAGFGLTERGRDYRIGVRLCLATDGAGGFTAGFEATRPLVRRR